MIPATLPRPDFNIHWDIPVCTKNCRFVHTYDPFAYKSIALAIPGGLEPPTS